MLNRVYDTVKEILRENSGVEISAQFTGVIRDRDLLFCRPTPLDEIEQWLGERSQNLIVAPAVSQYGYRRGRDNAIGTVATLCENTVATLCENMVHQKAMDAAVAVFEGPQWRRRIALLSYWGS